MDGDIFVTAADFERVAARRLSPETFALFSNGAVGERTKVENCIAYDRWRFRPRCLRNVSSVDSTTTVIGSQIPFPICIAPTATHKRACLEGEVATAKAAEALGIGMVLSMFSNCSMEEVAREAPHCIRWCHFQMIKNRDVLTHYVQRAERSGFSGLVVTIDMPVLSKRVNRTADGKVVRFRPIYECKNLAETIAPLSGDTHVIDAMLSHVDGSAEWEDIEWLKSITSLPVVVKGVLTEEMALEAVEHNVDGIIVSNHGGRQLDGTFATIDVLPEVVKAVDGRCDVYLDGGIRKGNDIVKAIALGAKAVFIGRPVLWGLACNGTTGAQNVLEMLRDEFVMTMKLIGVKSIKELQTTPNLLVHESQHFSKL